MRARSIWSCGSTPRTRSPYGRVLGRPAPPRGGQWLRVAVVRLPRISNATDAEALAAEPGVRVRLTVEPAELADADLVVLPGSKSTVDDLEWLRRDRAGRGGAGPRRAGPAGARASAAGSRCWPSGSTTTWRAARGAVPGLGLLPMEVTFARDKTRRAVHGGTAARVGEPVRGYEIHHG